LIIRPVGWLRQRTAGCRIASTVRFVISSRGARESERDHVRRAAMTEMRRVQPRHRSPVEHRDRHQRVANAFTAQHVLRDLDQSRSAQRQALSVRRHVNVQAHTDANSDVIPPLAVG
jgi:hypothetical protein